MLAIYCCRLDTHARTVRLHRAQRCMVGTNLVPEDEVSSPVDECRVEWWSKEEMDVGWNNVGRGAGAFIGVRVGICVGDGNCASWNGRFAIWGGQVEVVKLGCSSRGVQVGCCEFLASIP
jgi:hypothetical protein